VTLSRWAGASPIRIAPEGGRIEIRVVPADGSVEVSVRDTGVGIAPEDQEAIFEEFRQVGASAAKQEGTGLGLALCRKFVELHGGSVPRVALAWARTCSRSSGARRPGLVQIREAGRSSAKGERYEFHMTNSTSARHFVASCRACAATPASERGPSAADVPATAAVKIATRTRLLNALVCCAELRRLTPDTRPTGPADVIDLCRRHIPLRFDLQAHMAHFVRKNETLAFWKKLVASMLPLDASTNRMIPRSFTALTT
jgi:histidine kinase/DNA gyrase B/HSP90-like ATPase